MSCVSDDHDKNSITVPCRKYHEAFYDDTDYVVYFNERHAKIGPD
jgi:hypothetical protein